MKQHRSAVRAALVASAFLGSLGLVLFLFVRGGSDLEPRGSPSVATPFDSASQLVEPATEATVPEAGSADAGVAVRSIEGTIAGTVYLRSAPVPAPGARVAAFAVDETALPSAIAATDGAGRYELSGLAPGTYHVAAWRESWSSRWVPHEDRELTVGPGEWLEGVDRVLVPGVTVRGSVRDGESDAPIAAALVSEHRGLVASTDASGRFVLEGVRLGAIQIEAHAPGYATHRLETFVGEGRSDESETLAAGRERPEGPEGTNSGPSPNDRVDPFITIRLERGVAVFGRVAMPGGEPAGGAVVSARVRGRRLETRADARGSYRLEGLPLVEHALRLEASLDGLHASSHAVALRQGDGREVRVDLELVAGEPVAGRVVDGAGEPIARARLWSSSSGSRVLAVSAEDGAFRLEGFPDEGCVLTARRSGYAPGSVDLAELSARQRTRLEIVLAPGATAGGRVIDEKGRPVDEVWLHVTTASRYAGPYPQTLSDPDGAFRFSDLPADVAAMGARRLGYLPALGIPVELNDEEIEIVLAESGVLEGHVLDAATGSAIAEFTVRLEIASGPGERPSPAAFAAGFPASFSSPGLSVGSPDGRFRIADGLALGVRYALTVRAPEYVEQTLHGVEASLASSDGASLEIVLERGALLEGTVLDARTGSPIAGVRVRYLPAGPETQAARRSWSIRSASGNATGTDADGYFALTGVPRAPGVLCLEKSGYARTAYEEVAPVAVTPVFVLEEEAVLALRVQTAAGEPARGVEARLACGGWTFLSLLTDAGGESIVRGLPAGTATIDVTAPGHQSQSTGATLLAGETVELDLVLHGGSIRGVVSQHGTGIGGARVYARRQEESRASYTTRTESDGAFVLRGCRPGVYEVKAVRPGENVLLHRGASASVLVGDGESWCELRFGGASVIGVVADSDGRRLTSGEVTLYRRPDDEARVGLIAPGASSWIVQATAQPGIGEASFRFEALPSGLYAVAWTGEDPASAGNAGASSAWSESFRLATDALRREDLIVTREEETILEIVSAGAPVEGATAYLAPVSGGPSRVAPPSDDGGRIVFPGVPSGLHRASIRSPHHLLRVAEIEVSSEARSFEIEVERASWIEIELGGPSAAIHAHRVIATLLEGDDPGWEFIASDDDRPVNKDSYSPGRDEPPRFRLRTRPGSYRVRFDVARVEARLDAMPLVRREEWIEVPAAGGTVKRVFRLPDVEGAAR